LIDWLEASLPAFFVGRILPVDAAVESVGRTRPRGGRCRGDSLLAATAIEYDLNW
jgi:hypothetical protein